MAHQFNQLRVRTAVVFLLLLIPFLVLSLIAVDQERIFATQRARSDAMEITRVIASENANHIESTHLLLTALAQLSSVQSRRLDACSPLFVELLKQYPLFTSIFAVNTDTNIGFCSSTQPNPPTDNSSSEWYQALLATKGFVIGNYRVGIVTHKPGLTLAMPVFDQQSNLIAAVAISISLEWFNQLIQNIQLPQDSLVVILDGQGNVLAHNQPTDRYIIGQPYDDTDMLKMVLANKSGSVETTSDDGVAYLCTYTAVGPENGNLHVIIGFSEPVLFAQANEARNRTIIIFSALSIGALAIVWFSSGVLTRPIRRLTSTVYEVIDGKITGLSQGQTQIVELQALLTAFDKLIAHITTSNRQQVDNLETVNQQLRSEVNERTRAQQQSKFLQELSAHLSEASTTAQVSSIVLRDGTNYLGAASGAFYILSEADQTPQRLAFYPDTPETDRVTAVPFSAESSIGQAIANKRLFDAASQSELWEKFSRLASSGLKDAIILPLFMVQGKLGFITYRFGALVDRNADLMHLLQTVVTQCNQVLERIRLSDEAQEFAKLQERHRLARDLHDTVSQTLFAATTIAEALPSQWDKNPDRAKKLATDLAALNRAAISEMRFLLLELRPESILSTDLSTLLNQLINAAAGRGSAQGQLKTADIATPLPPNVHEAVFRIAQECVNNILKHSEAANFSISLHDLGNGVRLTVRDDGKGFDEQSRSTGFGLNNMRERAEAIGANLSVESTPGQGVQVTLTWIPTTENQA